MPPKLSLCITTLNRAHVISATIESILSQATEACEIVVLDAASTDDTERLVADYARRDRRLRYFRQATNNGLDQDFDRAVQLAHGDYCWLFSDDDVLRPGSIDRVLRLLNGDLSLIVVNAEHRDFNMSEVLYPRLLRLDSDQRYGPGDLDRLFKDAKSALLVISCIIIKRAVWLERSRQPYYGSMFIHVGVIFQTPLPTEALVISEPLVSLRRGNTHSPALAPTAAFEVWAVKWPAVVSSLAVRDATKNSVRDIASLGSTIGLLKWRAAGLYSMTDYQRFIRPLPQSRWKAISPMLVCLIPGVLLNTLFLLYYSLIFPKRHVSMLQTLKESRFHLFNVFKVAAHSPSRPPKSLSNKVV